MFGDRIKALRVEHNLTQHDFAFRISENLTSQAVSKWETGKCYPEVETIMAIVKEFNVTLDDLFADELAERRSNQNDKFIERYPGAITLLTTLAECMELNESEIERRGCNEEEF